MVFRPNEYRNKDGVGMPADDLATDTTSAWTSVALLKGIFGKLGGGTANVFPADVAQGSTTSGQLGGLVQAAATTAAPTYTTGKTHPLSLETDGDLRTHDAAATAILSTLNLSTDGLEAALGIITETAPATDTASSGLNGRLQRVAQRLTSLIALVPASLGAKTAAGSLSVTTATDDNTLALFGAVTETAPATDTASSGLNGRLQRIAQRVTSLIALVPASLGAKTAAASFSVTTATDDALIPLAGALTETAPATDTASSGLNGRLQRVAQRLTSLIALVPASLGQKAMSASLAVVVASDQTTLPAKELRSTTGTESNVSGNASSVTVLASNANRLGATVTNDSTAILYLLLGSATASTTVYSVQLAAGDYYEVPFNYTGQLTGIWASATGAARVTEMT